MNISPEPTSDLTLTRTLTLLKDAVERCLLGHVEERRAWHRQLGAHYMASLITVARASNASTGHEGVLLRAQLERCCLEALVQHALALEWGAVGRLLGTVDLIVALEGSGSRTELRERWQEAKHWGEEPIRGLMEAAEDLISSGKGSSTASLVDTLEVLGEFCADPEVRLALPYPHSSQSSLQCPMAFPRPRSTGPHMALTLTLPDSYPPRRFTSWQPPSGYTQRPWSCLSSALQGPDGMQHWPCAMTQPQWPSGRPCAGSEWWP